MRKLLLPFLILLLSITTAVRADYWTYLYLMYNGFMMWDSGKFASKQALAMVLGTVADPNSIVGKTGGLLDEEMKIIQLNGEEKETVAKIFDAFGDPAAGKLHMPADTSLGEASKQGAMFDSMLQTYLDAAKELGLDPTQLQALGAMNHHLARTQAFDYALRQYERMGGHPLTLNERWAFKNEINTLTLAQLNHQMLAKIAATQAKTTQDQLLATQRAQGMAVLKAMALRGQNPSTVNPEYYASPSRVQNSPDLYKYSQVDLLRTYDGQLPGMQGMLSGGDGSLASSAYNLVGVSTAGIAGTNGGALGCAAAVSMIFKNATGQDILPGQEMVLGTGELYSGLSNDPRFAKVPLSQAQAGDIVVTARGSRAGHTGVVVDNGRIISNSSSGFQGSAPGTIQNNYSIASWQSSITPRNPNQTAAFRYVGG